MVRSFKIISIRRLRLFLAVFAIACLNLHGQESIRIVTYNLKNYLVMDRLVEGQWTKNYPKPEAEKSIIQKNILEVRPDILVIQEIGGKDFLNELKNDLNDLGLDYAYSFLMKGSDPIRHTAILS
jgi:mRNA deadenylase 3'-5' endonuclease subunit Ccr4